MTLTKTGRKITAFFFITILMMCIPASAFAGYTVYSASNINGNVTQTLSTPVYVSDAELTIHNNAIISTVSDGTVQTRMRKITVPASGTTDLSNQVLLLTVAYDSDMQSDFDDIRVTNLAGTVLQQKYSTVVAGTSALIYVQVPTVYASQTQTLYMTYGSATAARYSVSGLTIPTYSNSVLTDGVSAVWGASGYVLVDTFTHTTTAGKGLQPYQFAFYHRRGTSGSHNLNYKMTMQATGGSETTIAESSVSVASTSYTLRTVTYSPIPAQQASGTSVVIKFYIAPAYQTYIDDTSSTCYVKSSLSLTYDAGTEYTLLANYTITATINGVNDFGVITYDGQDVLTFSPAASVSEITFVSNSWDWDYSNKLYWTENTATYVESTGVATAIITATYKPAATITSGTLDFTYSVTNFSQMYVVGNPTVTLDGVDKSAFAVRDNQTVTLSVTNLNTNTHTIIVSVPYDTAPAIISPANTTEVEVFFPPLLHSTTLIWQDVGYDAYEYKVAKDVNFAIMIADATLFDNQVTLNLEDGIYFWKVRGYNSRTKAYSPYSEVAYFDIVESSYALGTAINGAIYEVNSNNVPTALPNAIVTVYNETWAVTSITGTTGYFECIGLAPASTYFVYATLDGYTDSAIMPVTTVAGETITYNIIMSKETAPNYIIPHQVKFIVRSFFGKLYSGVTVGAYQGTSAIPITEGITGTDGAVVFTLSEDIKYTIRSEHLGLGIFDELVIYPIESEYKITVWPAGSPPEIPVVIDDKVLYGVAFNQVNLSVGNISAAVKSMDSEFINYEIQVTYLNGTIIDTVVGETSSRYNYTKQLSTSEPYYVYMNITHPDLEDEITKRYTITWQNGIREGFDFGWDEQWKYVVTGYMFMILVGGLFSKFNAHIGVISVAGVGIFNLWTGWYPSDTATQILANLGIMVTVIYLLKKQGK